jgi:protocatechuate 3,4-dioxygenase beta subunit
MPELERSLMTRRAALSVLGTTVAGAVVAGATGTVGPAAAAGTTRAAATGTTRAAAAGTRAAAARAAGACTLVAEQEMGPFYVAYDRVRADIVGGAVGLPLELEITIISSLTCKPITNAAVDIWQCDADGVYSSESSENTVGQTFLRGVQFTDKLGQVTFKTIYPGHYSGRTTHIHAKVHIGAQDADRTMTGGHVSHVGQMFPSDVVNAEVYKLAPYNTETAAVVTHAEDRVWTQQHGAESQLKLAKVGHRLAKGLTASVALAVNPREVPAAVGAT